MSNRMPLAVRMAVFRNKIEREKAPPAHIVPHEVGDSVIIAHDGKYLNAVVVQLPWYSDNERYTRVRVEGMPFLKIKRSQVVKVENL